MIKQNFKILTSFWFVFGLSILLLNDFLLKDIFGNWLTGKLSDFAGLFVFLVFWATIFPKHKLIVAWITAILFIFWKSQYSQTLIDIWNSLDLLNIYRTVDYSDLFALLILPIAYKFSSSDNQLVHFNINPSYPFVLSAFAFAATSYRSDVDINSNYIYPHSRDILIDELNKIDWLSNNLKLSTAGNNIDTFNLEMKSTFCFDKIDISVAIIAFSDSTSGLSLISAEHRCPESKKDKEKIIEEFEKKVINKLK